MQTERVPAPQPVANDPTGPTYNVRLVMAIWFVTGVVDVLVGLRFLLKALGASTASSFTTLLYGLTDPLVAPFQGIFANSFHRFYVLEPGDLVALVIYSLIGWGLVSLLRILTAPRSRRTVD